MSRPENSPSLGVNVTDPQGRIVSTPSRYGQAFRHLVDQNTDAYQEELVTVQSPIHDGSGDIVSYSKRNVCVSRWHTIFNGGAGDVGWMWRGPGFGSSLLPNERWTEETISHNPTMGGGGGEPPAYDTVNTLASPPVYSRIQNFGDHAILEGCVIPLDFDSYGFEIATNNRGGDYENFLIWPRARIYQRVEVNAHGMPHVHCITHWFYFPKAWRREPTGGPGVQFWSLAGAQLVDYFQQGVSPAQWYDPTRRLVTSLGAEWTGNNLQGWRADAEAQFTVLFGAINRNDPYPFVGRAAAALLEGNNGVASFGIGTYGNLFRESRGETQNTQLLLQTLRNAPFPVNEDPRPANGEQMAWFTRGDSRIAGWVGHRYWILTAGTESPQSALQLMVDRLHAQRLADQEIPFTVPAEVIDGMDPAFDNRFGPRNGQRDRRR